MPEFSATEFFNRRLQELNNEPAFSNQRLQDLAAAEAANPANTRLAELARVSAEKQAVLGSQIAKEKKRQEVNRASVAAKLGLNPDAGMGSVVNTAVATASELADIPLAAAIQMLDAAGQTDSAEYLRTILNNDSGTAVRRDTNERQSGLVRRLGDAGVATAKGVVGLGDAVIGVGDIATLGLSGKGWEALGRDSKATNQMLDKLYSPEQQLANQKVDQATGFLSTVETMLDNPSSIPKGILESLPAMLAGGKIGQEALAMFPKVAALVGRGGALSQSTAGAIGEGTLMAGGQAENIRQETADGRLTLKQALLSAGTGVMGGLVSKAGGQLANRLGVGDIDQAMVAGQLAKSPRGYTASIGLSGAIEAGEEGLQSAGETALQNIALDKPVGDGVGKAVAQGMLTAAPMGAYSGLGERVGQGIAKDKAQQTAREVQAAAIASGDVSALVDPKKPTYDPAMAISALVGNSALPTATPESKQANLAKASEIIASLQAEKDRIQATYDSVSPESLQATKDKVSKAKADLARETDPAKAQSLREYIDLATEQITTAPKTDPKELAKLRADLDTVNARLTKAQQAHGLLNESVNAGEVDVAAEVATITAPVAADDSAGLAAKATAAKRLIVLSMAVPERLDTKVAESLASDLNNGLSDDQRSYLRAFSEARVAENRLKTLRGVSQEIYFGGNGNLGISDHRQAISAAIASGNQALADRQLSLLQNFEADHRGKAEMVAKAWERQQATGKTQQVVRNQATKSWELNTGKLLNRDEAKKNGAPTIHMNTPESLVTNMVTEAKAITAALAEMQAAYAVQFSKPQAKTQGAPNVPVVSQAPEARAPETAPASNKEAPTVGSTAPASRESGKSSARTNTGNTGVESPGVKAPVAADTQSSASEVTVPDSIRKLSDEALNKALNDEMSLAGYQNSERFKQLDAEMSRRETEASSVDQQASPDAVATTTEQTQQSTDAVEANNQSTDPTVNEADSVKSEASSESAEQTSTDTKTSTAGAVFTEADKSAEGTPYQERNVIADFFSQRPGKEGDATARPLVAMKDFLSTGWDFISQFVSTEIAEGSPHLKALNHFWDTAIEWNGIIQKNLFRRPNKAYWVVDDLVQFLMQETEGKLGLPENVKTAISHAAYAWMVENATRSPYNSPEDINEILGRDKDHVVERPEEDLLRDVGTRQNVIVNSLGQKAVQALGFKASKDAPVNLGPKLESALGAYALKLLMDQGIIDRYTISAAEMARLTGSSATGAAHLFVQLARNEDGKLHPVAEAAYQASKGAESILDKLFGVEPGLKAPSLEPVKFNQATTKNTNQQVPSVEAKIIQKQNEDGWRVKQGTYSLIAALDEDIVLQMAGGITVDPTEAHIANRAKNEAKNDGLKRELQRIKEFVADLLTKDADLAMPVYFEHTVWKQQRVGKATNMVNPQTSKIHRHMLYLKSWETTVDLQNPEQAENFSLRVAEGLGIKTDKQNKAKALAELAKKGEDPRLQKAVAVLIKHRSGETLSQAEQESLLAAVQFGGEGMHTLDALVALAEAFASDGKPFKTMLMGEVDGVTNGPMLSHLLMGAANSVKELFALLNRGGFYELGNEHTQYNLWRGVEGHFDLYETTAGHMAQAVQALTRTGVFITTREGKQIRLMTAAEVQRVLPSVYAFTGTLTDTDAKAMKAKRNIIKTPLTAMVFGSSTSKAVDSMANGFVESIYAAIEDTAKGKADAQALPNLIGNINLLLSQGKASGLSPKLTIQELMDTEFTQQQIDGLKKVFSETVGAAVKSTMEEDFAPFIEQRRQFNLAAQVAFQIYDSVYSALREQLVNELIEKGELPYREVSPKDENGKAIKDAPKIKEPLHDLTAVQEGELRKRLAKMAPVMHTLMSKDSNQLRAGLYMSKTGRKLSTRSTFEGEIRFATPFPDNGAKSTGTRAYETAESEPGVAMAPMSVHSTDSAISHYAAMLGEVLNIHDAHGAGLATFEQTARNLNQATWNAMLNYSPASEMQAALSRTVMGLAEQIQQGNLPPAAMENLTKALVKIAEKQEGMSPADVIGLVMGGMKATAFHADNTKLQALEQMQAIDQYALEGGNYVVTEKDRADAAARRAGLSDALSKEEEKAIEVIQKALGEPAKQEVTRVETPLEEDPPKPKPSPFGEVGKPKRVDQRLLDLFKDGQTISAEQAIKGLLKILDSMPGKKESYHRTLLEMLLRGMPSDVKVRLVTPETSEKDVLSLPKTKSFGWIAGNEIYILSDGFVNSGLQSVGVLMHELVHGAVMQVVENPGKAAKVLVAQLQELMAKAAEYAKQNNITKFDDALNDVHEFIAYGMTRQSFQRMLAQIAVDDSVGPKSNVLINGFKKFINTLTGLLFEQLGLKGFNKKDQVNTALGQLVKNVTGLVNQAEKETGRATTSKLVLSMATDPVGTVNTYSTLDIHRALNAGSVSTAFGEKLHDLLAGIVETLHGPYGAFKAELMRNQAMTPVDVWHKALATGKAPFASSVLASPFVMSEQEAHAMEQVEVTMRAALSRNETTATSAYRELNKLYTEALSIIKPSDLASQAEYDFLFKVDLNQGTRSDYLARFVAFGLANEQVNKLLQKSTKRSNSETPATFVDKLAAIWKSLLDFFHEKITGTYRGQQADIKLNRLVEQLVDIEAKKRIEIARRASKASSFLDPIEDGARNVVNKGIQKVVDLAGTDFIKNNRFAPVKFAGSFVRMSAEHRVDAFMEEVHRFRDKHWPGKLGILTGTLSYAMSGNQVMEALLRARKLLEGDRKDIITRRSAMALQAFANQGKDLSSEDSAAITQVFMRTGMHVLTGQFSLGELEQMLNNKPALDAAIQDLEAQLSGPFKDDYISQANALAYFKVTGRNKAPVLMMNAHNIARMYGTSLVSRVSPAQANQATPIIEKLVALYAMGYTAPVDLNRAKAVLRKENSRKDGGGNGVSFVLALHKKLEEESKARLFKNQDALMVHGYTPEIYSPHVEVVTAPESDSEALQRRGYVKGAQVAIDPAHPDQTPKHLYVLEGGGLMPYLTGIVSYTDKNTKGNKQHSGYMNVNTADGLANASLHADIAHGKAQQRKLAKGPRVDLSKVGGTYMAPVLNPQGDIVNWRYLMQDSTKDSVLKRDNRFNVVLGTLAGSIVDKSTTTEINKQVFEALKEQWNSEGASRPEAYVLVGPKSKDDEARQIWNMLPEESKAEARRIWGKDGIYVRNDMRDIVFGYRKLSLADAVRDTQERRAYNEERIARGQAPLVPQGMEKQFEHTMAKMLTVVVEQQLTIWARTRGYKNPEEYGQRAALMVGKGERMWQELVSEVKDTLVIKTISVMMGNIKSNVSLLVLSGVPLADMVKHHVTAWRGAVAYQKDSTELDRLETLVSTGQTNGKDAEIQRQIARLKDAIDRNPVRDLIEAGLMPTIVEDASADEDIYSYKSHLVQLGDKISEELHPLVKDTVKTIYMAKDTQSYKTLRQITQLSDFMARYTEYQYLTTRKKDPLTKAEAIQRSSEDFVNYDIPMHRGMQYLDDMGIMMFMKYFLRIQKVIGRVTKENPARVLTAVAMGHYLSLDSIVLNSSWIHHAGNNPLQWGALQYPGSLTELATIDGAMSLVK